MSLRLVVEPSIAPYDEPFSMRVDGVSVGDAVVVSAELTEVDGTFWRSRGDYEVGPAGYLADPMRVIWSAERAQGTAAPTRVGPDIRASRTWWKCHSNASSTRCAGCWLIRECTVDGLR
jgi:hypothetical protein